MRDDLSHWLVLMVGVILACVVLLLVVRWAYWFFRAPAIPQDERPDMVLRVKFPDVVGQDDAHRHAVFTVTFTGDQVRISDAFYVTLNGERVPFRLERRSRDNKDGVQ
jgi:hypothetical protein